MPTEFEIEQALRCEFRGACCLKGTDCRHPSNCRVGVPSEHCEDLVNDDRCYFILQQNINTPNNIERAEADGSR